MLVAGNGHYLTVADGIVLVGVGFTRRVVGGGEAVERIVGVADPARDVADGLRDVRAVAGGVQRVGIVRQHGCAVRADNNSPGEFQAVAYRGRRRGHEHQLTENTAGENTPAPLMVPGRSVHDHRRLQKPLLHPPPPNGSLQHIVRRKP